MIPPDQYRYGSLKDDEFQRRDEAKPQYFRAALVWIVCTVLAVFVAGPIATIAIGIVATIKGLF